MGEITWVMLIGRASLVAKFSRERNFLMVIPRKKKQSGTQFSEWHKQTVPKDLR